MSRHRITSFVRSTRTMAMSVLLVAGVTLSACGPLGDDDSDPTATSETIEQPTTSATEEAPGTESGDMTDTSTEPMEPGTPVEDGTLPSTPQSFGRGTPVTQEETEATTEVVSVSTPVLDLEQDGTPVGTPVTDGQAPLATPSDPEESGDSTTAPTEEATGNDTSSPSSFGGSDGTSGATPPSDSNESNEEPSGPGTDEATPFFVRDDPTPTPENPEASPVSLGTPVAPADATILDVAPVMVTSCEPEAVPEITIEQVVYLTTEDVNFRTGPGADCDLISTIGINQEATLLGGPVTREEDNFVWAQVQIAGEVGWVVVDVLEPAG